MTAGWSSDLTWYPDLGNTAMVCRGPFVRAVGWLHADHPFTKGSVPAETVTRLKDFVQLADESTTALGWGLLMGIHTCEFCGRDRGLRNFGVPTNNLLYVVPEMIVHYIEEHGYAPPVEFIAALMSSPLPNTAEYRVAVEGFRSTDHGDWVPLL